MSDSKDVLVDVELKEMIVRALESSGALQNIRAQLRAATYLTLEGQQDFSAISPARAMSQTESGLLAIQLVRDFLLQSQLPHTLGVLDVEIGRRTATALEDSLAAGEKLNLQPGPDRPLILQILDIYQNQFVDSQRPKTAARKNRNALPSSGDQSFDDDTDVLATD